MKTQHRSVTHSNGDCTPGFSLRVVSEKVHDPNPTRHLQPGLYLHRGPSTSSAAEPTEPIPELGRAHRNRTLDRPGCSHIRIRNREGLDGESGGHELGLTRFDLAGGYEHEPDLVTGVEQLERAVVVAKRGPVGVPNGDELGEGEVNGGVEDGEGGELDGADGDFGVLGFEDGEVNDEGDDDDEDKEDCGDYA